MLIKQLSIELENRLGNLSRITGVLSRHGISMSAFSIFTTAEGGVLRIIVPHPMLAVDILGNHNYKVVVDDVVCLKLKDVSGQRHSWRSVWRLSVMNPYLSKRSEVYLSITNSALKPLP